MFRDPPTEALTRVQGASIPQKRLVAPSCQLQTASSKLDLTPATPSPQPYAPEKKARMPLNLKVGAFANSQRKDCLLRGLGVKIGLKGFRF